MSAVEMLSEERMKKKRKEELALAMPKWRRLSMLSMPLVYKRLLLIRLDGRSLSRDSTIESWKLCKDKKPMPSKKVPKHMESS